MDHRGGASLTQSLHTKLIRTVLPLNGQDCPFLRFGAGARTFILGVMFFPMDGSNIGKIAAILIRSISFSPFLCSSALHSAAVLTVNYIITQRAGIYKADF